MKSQQVTQLIRAAQDARRRAYAPYSKFRVGAALLTQDGRIFQGCNVENASYGLSLCAERAAVCAAIVSGYRQFKAIAVVGGGKQPPYPCGACLQVLAEFGKSDFLVILASSITPSMFKIYRLSDLLPKAFRLP